MKPRDFKFRSFFFSAAIKKPTPSKEDLRRLEEKRKLLKSQKPKDMKIERRRKGENEATPKDVDPTLPSKTFQSKRG